MFTNVSCADIMNFSGMNPFHDEEGNDYRITGDTHLSTALGFMVERNLRRLAVIRPDNKLIGILSQSDVIRWFGTTLKQDNELEALGKKSVTELSLCSQGIVSIDYNQTTLQAFWKIREAGVSGIGIIDERSRLVGHISATDIKVIRFDSSMFKLTSKPLKEYSTLIENKPMDFGVVKVKPDDTLEQVIETFKSRHVHQVYVVDDQNVPQGIISLIDIIRLLYALGQ